MPSAEYGGTSAVLLPDTEQYRTGPQAGGRRIGSGRSWAPWRRRVAIAHPTLHTGDNWPECREGMPLPAATQWDLMAAAAKPIRPVLEELIRQAAQGSVM